MHPPYAHSELSREDGTVVHRSQLGWDGESLVSKEGSGSEDEDEEESVGDESTNLQHAKKMRGQPKNHANKA